MTTGESGVAGESEETRQERREKKLRKKRERIPQHSRGLAQLYTDAVKKKAKGK